MKKKSFYKDLIRSIYKTRARFLSILSIIALGVGFFAGINATEPDMLLSADAYYKDRNLSDFRIISPLGFTGADIENIKRLTGIETIQEGYSRDIFLTSGEGNTSVVKLYSYNTKDYSGETGLNKPVVVEGRMPENTGEIAIDRGKIMHPDMKIGGQVKLSLPNEEDEKGFLITYSYTVVGFINSPMYIDFERGQTNIGDGSIDFFAYVLEDDFKLDKITDLYIRTSDSINLAAYSKEYIDHLSPIEASLKDLGTASIAKETKSMRDELSKGREELVLNKQKSDRELTDGEKKLISSEKEIIKGEIELNNNEKKYKKEFEEQRKTLNDAKKDIQNNRALYNENYNKWLVGYNTYKASKVELDKTKTELDAANNQISQSQKELDNLLVLLESTSPDSNPQYETLKAQYDTGVKLLKENRVKYEAGLKAYQEGAVKLSESKAVIDKGKSELDMAKAALDGNEKKIAQGEAALKKGEENFKSSLEKGRKSLADARLELAEGKKTFDAEKKLALEKIADAEIEIKDAERQLMKIPDNWFVLTREGNPGYSGYGDDAERIGAVAKVFPLFFFLVAALVCLTTMTRMIDEERTQIGTMKSLGYNTLTISSKYLIYSILASLIGTFLGLAVGFKLFPGVIMNAYQIMYKIPVKLTPFHVNYMLISLIFAVATIIFAVMFAILQELRLSPAALIQPKAPVPGKRILLERIAPLWNRLSFSRKVTARNIFRYKRRLFMTVIGIAGCTALLVTGFGLRDSINDIMNKQFKEIFIYDAQVMLDEKNTNAEKSLEGTLKSYDEIKAQMKTLSERVNVLASNSGRTYETNLIVPEKLQGFNDFFDLHERVSREGLNLTGDGAIITEKLSRLLNLKTGDTLTYRDSDSNTFDIKIAGIAENYLSHYIYMSPEYFDRVTLETPLYNSTLLNFENPEKLDENAFKEELIKNDGILGVMFLKSLENNFGDTMKSLDYVVLVLIISAGLLAFVVLYNLTNINVTERIREIATIKVLGFRENEVSIYVYRENIILTIIGTMAGLLLGVILHSFVINTMEIDTMMFGRKAHLISFILSVLLTMFFSILVNLFMKSKLRNINMVESLKSIE